MPTITIPSFGGEKPITTPRLLEATQALKAINCQIEQGCLAPLRGPAKVADLSVTAKTIFKHKQNGWLSWPKVVSVVKSAVHDVDGETPLGHLFITGDRSYPTQYLADGTTYRLGVPRPSAAPEVSIALGAVSETVKCYAWGTNEATRNLPRYGYESTLNEIENSNVTINATYTREAKANAENEGITTDSGIERSSIYCYTVVQTLADGLIQQESAPSPPSEIVEVLDGDGVRISGFEIPNPPGNSITHIRIYRTLSGLSTSEFHFLAELELPLDEYIDTTLDKDLSAEVLQTTTWDAIPDDAKGLVVTNNGIYAAFRGNEVLISVPNIAYAFPPDYAITVEDQIVALGHTDNTIIVLTEGRPYLISGSMPSQMQVTHLPIEQSCDSALSVAHLPGGLWYASPDGLMSFTANDQGLATAGIFTRDQWQELKPHTIMGAILDNKYLGFFAGTSKGFIITIGSDDLVRFELPEGMTVQAVYHHSLDDCIYLSVDMHGKHGIWQWEAGDEMEYIWQSKPFFTSRLCSMKAVRIEGEQTAKSRVQINIYAHSMERARQKLCLENTRSKRIMSMRSEKLWGIELIGKAPIYEARLGTSVEEVEYGA